MLQFFWQIQDLFFRLSAKGTGDKVGKMEPPLSPIAPAIRPFDNGEAICALTAIEPADSPAIVTRFGSPPNFEILACTHFKAAF